MLRRKGLTRTGFLRRVAIVRRHVYTGPSPRVRSTVRTRAGHTCEWPDCGRVGTDYHHRLNRKMGGRHGLRKEQVNSPAWIVLLCREHHRRVTSSAGLVLVEAQRWGWVLSEADDAETVGIYTAHGWVLLDNIGGCMELLGPPPEVT